MRCCSIKLHFAALCLFGLVLAACPPEEIEGDGPEECRDGADNDQDGYFDCQDNGCWNSPDCLGDDDDAADDDDATGEPGVCGTGTETAGLTAFTLSYSMSFDYNPKPANVTDCAMEYSAAGTTVRESAGLCIRFDGSWTQTSSSCPETFDDLIWVGSGEAEHSFVFGAGMSTLELWRADDIADGWSEEGADWAVWDMSAAYTPGTTVEYVELVPVPGQPLTVTHTVNVDFVTVE